MGKNNFLPKTVPQKIIWLSKQWMRPGQHGYLSMFKVTLGCCITLGLDSTTLEHPFPGLKPNSLNISQGTCREDLGFRGVRTYFTCIQRRRWLGLRVRWSCSISDPDRQPFQDWGPGQRPVSNHHKPVSRPGPWPEAHPAESGQEPGLYV